MLMHRGLRLGARVPKLLGCVGQEVGLWPLEEHLASLGYRLTEQVRDVGALGEVGVIDDPLVVQVQHIARLVLCPDEAQDVRLDLRVCLRRNDGDGWLPGRGRTHIEWVPLVRAHFQQSRPYLGNA
eukprot:scaffold15540_cov31-Tisochrysis_lutea.AAC.2